MGLVAAALGLDASWFDPMLEPNASTFAMNHYPPREDEDGTDDAVIVPLKVCVGDNDPHYGPITPYEWERDFIARTSKRRALEVDPKVERFLETLKP